MVGHRVQWKRPSASHGGSSCTAVSGLVKRSSSAGASSSEVDALRKEIAKLQDLLAKERYRIKHLIRAIEAKS